MNLINGTPFPDMFEFGMACQSDNCLQQGDIIKKSEKYKIAIRPHAIGFLVVSNSCDLDHYNVSAMLFVPIYPFSHWYRDYSYKPKELADKIKKEANYERKVSFFISPLDGFNDKPSVAFIDDIISVPISRHIFKWEEVPGDEDAKFKDNLSKIFSIKWIKDAEIKKIDRTIRVSTGDKSLILELSEDKENVILTLENGKIINLVAVKKGSKLNVAITNQNIFLKDKVCSMKSPWREQLGWKMGNLFNRISTYTPEDDEIDTWAEKNKVNI